MKLTVYENSPALRQPLRLAGEMVQDLLAGRELAWRLLVRNISAMYRQTILGYVWAFLPPLLSAGTFIVMQRGGIIAMEETPVPFALWALTGAFTWQLFADSLSLPIRHVGSARGMLTKLNFPREALILSAIGEAVFNYLIRLIMLVPMLFYFRVVPTWELVFLPFGLAVLCLLGAMVGTFLIPLSLLYKDVERTIPLMLPFLMLVSGAVVPLPSSGMGASLARFNPVYPVLEWCRNLLLGQETVVAAHALAVGGGALLLAFVAWLIYRISLPHLIARLGG